ncbi:MAG: hypothetical protein M3342_09350 [Bacteroidota bacterium]|nr:hypothetical protein [Bacteroidota bacterium]
MDRKQKIKLLQELSKGLVRAEDLQDKDLGIRIGGPDAGFYINGVKVDEETFRKEEARQGNVTYEVYIGDEKLSDD